jgi:hypothetical protein
MKRVLVIAVLAATLVVGATVAEAAIKRGTFKGKTSAADPVGLSVNASGRVVNFYYEGVKLECTDGDSFDTPTGANRIQTPNSVKFKVSSKGKFTIRARNKENGFGWDVAGRFRSKGAKTTGTLKVRAKFNDQNQQDPNGSITCESAKLSFTLKRK